MRKQLIFVRHAHRDTSQRSLDNGLSEKGKRQARWIKKFALSRFAPDEVKDLKATLLSSGKKRCLETLEPLAEAWKLKVEIKSELMEHSAQESHEAFKMRIEDFLSWWINSGPALLFVSSHGDWLPVACQRLLGIPVEMKKGAWLEIEWEEGAAFLTWYVPSFKAFYGD